MTLTRFAPSPTGWLHLGHAYAAQQAFGFGACLLRIEDIDHTRCKPDLTRAILEDLRWLGFDWPEPVRVQSEHAKDHQGVVEALAGRGLLYEDYTTRTGREDRSLPPAVKLSVARAAEALGTDRLVYQDTDERTECLLEGMDDPTLVRRDIGSSYHVAVTHDDWAQKITDVVRGRDLKAETPVHVLIQTLMGWPVPRYHHHALVMEDDGTRKLSKRHGSLTVRSLREAGHGPDAVLAMAAAKV